MFGKHFSHGLFASVKCPFRNRAKENEGTKKRPTAKIKKEEIGREKINRQKEKKLR
jgi:hypothetical protein